MLLIGKVTCFMVSKQKERTTMKLNEIFKICLLALASRYPTSIVDINETVLGHLSFWSEACSPLRLIELLQINAPQLLDAHACLVIDQQKSEIMKFNKLTGIK
jgi:hypothetical protein